MVYLVYHKALGYGAPHR